MLEILVSIFTFSIGVVFGYIARVHLVHSTEYAGTILVTQTEDKKIFSLELDTDPDTLEDADEVLFKVNAHPSVKAHRD